MNFNRHRVLTHGISLADFSLALTAPADPHIKSPAALPEDFRKTEEGVRRTAPVSTACLHWYRPCKDALGPHGVVCSGPHWEAAAAVRTGLLRFAALALRCLAQVEVSAVGVRMCLSLRSSTCAMVFPSVLGSTTQTDSSLFSPSLQTQVQSQPRCPSARTFSVNWVFMGKGVEFC